MSVIILRGCPGSGKSFHTKNLIHTIISADHFFMKNGEYIFDKSKLFIAHKICFDKFMKFISQNTNVCVDNTNAQLKELEKYIKPALLSTNDVKVITFLCDVDICFKRNQHSVPREVIERMDKSIRSNLDLSSLGVEHEIINNT